MNDFDTVSKKYHIDFREAELRIMARIADKLFGPAPQDAKCCFPLHPQHRGVEYKKDCPNCSGTNRHPLPFEEVWGV